MGFNWGPAKARANLSKHGIHFADAVTVLEDERALTIRDPLSDEEERWITLGCDAASRVLVVVYTWRGDDSPSHFRAASHAARAETIRRNQ